LPQGPKEGGRYNQPYISYEKFIDTYKKLGGSVR